MSVIDKLMFWKKSEVSDYSPSSSLSSGSADAFGMNTGASGPPNMGYSNASGFSDSANFGGASGSGQSGFGQSSSGMAAFPTGMSSPATSDPFASTNPAYGQQVASNPFAAQSSASQFSVSQLPDRNSTPAEANQIHPRDIELILSRLELVRSEIENVNHRLSYIEQSVGKSLQSNTKGPRGNWY